MKHSINRRQTLRLLGGGLVIAATPACSLIDPEPTAALSPWRSAGQGYEDLRLRALSWAILAPNPHNRQPWQIRLDGADGFTLFCDRTRLLPETDPFCRQIVIGLGCFT